MHTHLFTLNFIFYSASGETLPGHSKLPDPFDLLCSIFVESFQELHQHSGVTSFYKSCMEPSQHTGFIPVPP